MRTTALLAVLLLSACGEASREAAAPAPAPLDREAIGHYCQMIVADHQGPKAQIFLADRAEPIWFSSVRDGVAFTRLPEEPKNIAAFYVNDMSDTAWEKPDDSTWIAAEQAWFVLGSSRVGGMGAPEVVPFVTEPAAVAFAASHGGEVVRLASIPDDYVLGEVPSSPMPTGSHTMHDDSHVMTDGPHTAHEGSHAMTQGAMPATESAQDGGAGGDPEGRR